MGKVYANGMEVCSGGSTGKTAGAMPDVCFTQPMAPPTPQGVPIPYPSTGMPSDLKDGSVYVVIGGKPIALKDKSYFSGVKGDEAGNAGTKGVVALTNEGKLYFTSWSMNVKVEGANVVRHLDLSTHNHASKAPGNTPPWPFIASQRPVGTSDDDTCRLRPYKPDTCASQGKTGHHVVPDHCFRQPKEGPYLPGGILKDEGLCVCVTGAYKSSSAKDPSSEGKRLSRANFSSNDDHYLALADHGRIHRIFDALERQLGAAGQPKKTATLGDLEVAGAAATAEVTGCDPEHLLNQLREHHRSKKLGPETRWRADPGTGTEIPADRVKDMGTGLAAGGGW